MFEVKSNISQVLSGLQVGLTKIFATDEVGRGVATTLLPVVKTRIHEDGKAADGSPIGTYSEEYMKVRTGQFKSNATYKSGKNKGKKKTSGVFTKGKNEGAPRPNYNRTSDTKVIGSLTRQMENDFKVVNTDSGGYGLGFSNEFNYLKSQYLEKTYNKKIYQLTTSEKVLARQVAERMMQEQLNTL